MKKHIGLMSFAGIIILVALVQFADSYQTELFDKLQSLFITEYFVEGRDMTFNAGAGLLNAAVMPCYAFSALAFSECRGIRFILGNDDCAVFLRGKSIKSYNHGERFGQKHRKTVHCSHLFLWSG